MSSHVLTPKWNIIFLIYADLSENTTPNSEDLAVDNISIQEQVAGIRNELLASPESPFYDIAIVTNLKGLMVTDPDNSFFYSLAYHPNGAPNTLVLQKTFEEGLVLQKGAVLTTALQQVEHVFTDDTRTLLITWDHGSGFGVMKQVQKEDDTKIIDMLTNDELADAIKNGTHRKKVDVVMMFNCFMHNLHTLYAMRDVTDYFVGPESIIAHPGYDYTAILKAIHNNPAIMGNELAAVAVNTIKAKFIRFGQERASKAEELIMMATDMSQLPPLFALIQELSWTLIRFMDAAPNAVFTIRRFRALCYEMTTPMKYDMVDLVNWLRLLIKKCDNPPMLLPILQQLTDQLKKARMASFIGNHPYSDREVNAYKKFPPTGYSCYVPENATYYSPIAENFTNYIATGAPYASSFIDGVQWRRFLDALFRRNLPPLEQLEVVAFNGNG